MSCFICFSCLG